jgi:fructose-1,6-bisphosphatase/sedoheptulose 1,7-bisphosphatase-like protein
MSVQLSPVNLKSREMELLAHFGGRFLTTYGLKLKKVAREILPAGSSRRNDGQGFLQAELRYPLVMLHTVGAAAVAASGLGLGESAEVKRMVDRSAADVQGVGLHQMLMADGNRVAVVAAAEGERVKEGEKGGNPARFREEVFGPEKYRADIKNILTRRSSGDVQIVSVVSDDVDGTGKATRGEHSSVSTGAYTCSEVKHLPDESLVKIVSSRRLPDHVSTRSSPEEIVQAFARALGVAKERLRFFCLIRPRHEEPKAKIEQLGPKFPANDKDGDITPALSASIGQYLYEDGLPLHGIAAHVGGAAEAALLIPVIWRGGSVLLEFASKSGLNAVHSL